MFLVQKQFLNLISGSPILPQFLEITDGLRVRAVEA